MCSPSTPTTSSSRAQGGDPATDWIASPKARNNDHVWKSISNLPSTFTIILIQSYRKLLSPFLTPRCRFHPTCSAYAIEALQVHGFIKGSWLALRRITRCHPLGRYGDDPVPHKDS